MLLRQGRRCVPGAEPDSCAGAGGREGGRAGSADAASFTGPCAESDELDTSGTGSRGRGERRVERIQG